MSESKIRVGIIEDNAAFRQSLSEVIHSRKNLLLTGAFESVEIAEEFMPPSDILLMDIHLPGKSGIEGIEALKTRFPDASIIMMTVFDDDDHISRAILSGARGYLLKRTPPDRVIQAIEDAAEGGMPMSPAVARKISDLYRLYAPEPHSPVELTPREKEVLSLLVKGHNFAMIAQTLFISFETVRNHTRKIYDKLHVHSKSEAVSKALRYGLI